MTGPAVLPDETEFERWKAKRAGRDSIDQRQSRDATADVPDAAEFEAWKAERTETPKELGRGVLQSAYQGLTFGLGNKLTAATRALLPQALGGTKGFDYTGALEEERALLDQFRSRHPAVAVGAEMAGGIPNALMTGGSSSAPTLARSVATGAGFGAAYGAGEPDSPTPGELARSTGTGAAFGALVGGGVHGAAKTLTSILDNTGVRPTRTGTGKAERAMRALGVTPVEDRALATIRSRLERAKLTPADVTATATEARELGKPMAMTDVGGQPMVRLARGAQGVPSKGADEIRDMLEGRRRGAPVRVASDVETGIGKNRQDTFETGQKLAEQQKAKASPLYERSMKAPPLSVETKVPGEEITLASILERPSAQKAISYESQLAKEEGRAPFPALSIGGPAEELTAAMSPEAKARLAAAGKEQGVEVSPTVTMQQLHNLKLRLDEMIGYGRRTNQLLDGTPATKKMIHAMEDTKNQLLKVMDAHESTYAQARQSWAGDAELQDALEMGRDFLNGKRAPTELAHELSQFSDAGKDHARIGIVDAVRDQIDRAPDGADVVRRIFGTEAQRKRLRVAFPDDASFSRFQRQMELESTMAKNETTILGNSQTAEKLADQADIVDAIPSGGNLLSVRGAGNALLRSGAAARLQGLARQRVDALAPYLTAGAEGSQSIDDVIREMARASSSAAPRNKASNALRALTAGQAGRIAGAP